MSSGTLTGWMGAYYSSTAWLPTAYLSWFCGASSSTDGRANNESADWWASWDQTIWETSFTTHYMTPCPRVHFGGSHFLPPFYNTFLSTTPTHIPCLRNFKPCGCIIVILSLWMHNIWINNKVFMSHCRRLLLLCMPPCLVNLYLVCPPSLSIVTLMYIRMCHLHMTLSICHAPHSNTHFLVTTRRTSLRMLNWELTKPEKDAVDDAVNSTSSASLLHSTSHPAF